MKSNNLRTRFVFTFMVISLSLVSIQGHAQAYAHSINASGQSTRMASGSISYSIGQVFYTLSSDTDHHINAGIQDPSISLSSSNQDIDVDVDTEVAMRIYPNPTPGAATLSSEGLDFTKLNSFRIFNYQGQLIHSEVISQQRTPIELSYLASGLYLIQIFVDEKLWNTIKLLKQ